MALYTIHEPLVLDEKHLLDVGAIMVAEMAVFNFLLYRRDEQTKLQLHQFALDVANVKA